MTDQPIEQAVEANDVPVEQVADQAVEQHQDAPEPVSVEQLARDLGWKPKDEWKGDGAEWRGADEFLRKGLERNKNLSRDVKELKDAFAKVGKVNERIVQQAVEKERRELAQQYARAVEAKDIEGSLKIIRQIDALDAPEPVNYRQKFAQDNPWFEVDEAATAYAIMVCDKNKDKDPEEQLRLASDAVRKRFPELSGERTREREEAPLVNAPNRSQPAKAKRYPPEVIKAAKDAVRRGRAANEGEYLAMYDQETA